MIVESYFYGYTIWHIRAFVALTAAVLLSVIFIAQTNNEQLSSAELNITKNYSITAKF